MPQDNYGDRVITGEVVPPDTADETADAETADDDTYQQTYLHKVASARPASGPPQWSSSAEDPTTPYPTNRASGEDEAPGDPAVDDQAVDDQAPFGTTPDARTPEDALPEDAALEHTAPEDARPDDALPDNATPDDALPEDATPEGTAPEDVAAEDAAAEGTPPAAASEAFTQADAEAGETAEDDEPGPYPAAAIVPEPGREETAVGDAPVAASTDPDLPVPADSSVEEEEEQRGRHRADVPGARLAEPAESAAPIAPIAPAEPVETGPEAVPPVPSARRPGDEAVPREMAGTLLTDGAEVREQWMRVQAAFVDDPRIAVSEAANLINDVFARLHAAVQERQQSLRGRWDGNSQADTESLRVTMQQYRALMERIAGL
jgi:hypothetical protein